MTPSNPQLTGSITDRRLMDSQYAESTLWGKNFEVQNSVAGLQAQGVRRLTEIVGQGSNGEWGLMALNVGLVTVW